MSDRPFFVGDRVKYYAQCCRDGEHDTYVCGRIGTIDAINYNGRSGVRGRRHHGGQRWQAEVARARVTWDASTTATGVTYVPTPTWVMLGQLRHLEPDTRPVITIDLDTDYDRAVYLHEIPEAVDLVTAFDAFVTRAAASAFSETLDELSCAVEAFREPKPVEAVRYDEV